MYRLWVRLSQTEVVVFVIFTRSLKELATNGEKCFVGAMEIY